jgi:hypothetical protein
MTKPNRGDVSLLLVLSALSSNTFPPEEKSWLQWVWPTRTGGEMAEPSTVVTAGVRTDEPARQVIATFDNYADAERAVDYLSEQRFEVDRLSIVGRELEYVEQVLGRMDYGTAALRGAASGAVVGALIGWIFGLFNWVEPLISALVLAGYGLVFVVYALQRHQRDFQSVSGLRPRYYDVVADVVVADRALQLLASGKRKE